MPVSRFFRPLAIGGWGQVLSENERIEVLENLKRLADSGDDSAAAVGIDLLYMWRIRNRAIINGATAPVALGLARSLVGLKGNEEFHEWRELLVALASLYPREVTRLITEVITTTVVPAPREESVEVFASAASVDSNAVMDVLGESILDRERRPIFGIAVFHGLFEAIGLNAVSEWVKKHGTETLPWLSRHFQSPYLSEDGTPVLPPLTEWLFREHEGNQKAFEWFCMGRSDRAWSESDTDPVRKRSEMQPFLAHHLRRVREWAQYEIKLEESEANFLKEWRDEDERR
jgi:hypothetical protein